MILIPGNSLVVGFICLISLFLKAVKLQRLNVWGPNHPNGVGARKNKHLEKVCRRNRRKQAYPASLLHHYDTRHYLNFFLIFAFIYFSEECMVVEWLALKSCTEKMVVQNPIGTFMCGICMFCLCMRGLSTPAFSHTPKKKKTQKDS